MRREWESEEERVRVLAEREQGRAYVLSAFDHFAAILRTLPCPSKIKPELFDGIARVHAQFLLITPGNGTLINMALTFIAAEIETMACERHRELAELNADSPEAE